MSTRGVHGVPHDVLFSLVESRISEPPSDFEWEDHEPTAAPWAHRSTLVTNHRAATAPNFLAHTERRRAVLVSRNTSKNPFDGHTLHVNPVTQGYYRSVADNQGSKKHVADARANLLRMANVPTAVWIDKKSMLRGPGEETAESVLRNAASKLVPELVVFIWYNLPDRDCAAKVATGEICCSRGRNGMCDYSGKANDCSDGVAEYKTEFVDPFVSLLQEFDMVPTVVVVEPDSVANLAISSHMPSCGNTATTAAYKAGVQYALQQLTKETAANLYVDAADGHLLGAGDNLKKYFHVLAELDLPLHSIRGFATNIGSHQPLGELCPWEPDHNYKNGFCFEKHNTRNPCCANPCKPQKQLHNPAFNALSFAQMLAKWARVIAKVDSHVIIDTSRNGVANVAAACHNWCNVRGTGAGVATTTHTADPFIDAYVWLKVPGKSDGCASCARHHPHCAFKSSLGSGMREKKAPEAGEWYETAALQLAAHAQLSGARTLEVWACWAASVAALIAASW